VTSPPRPRRPPPPDPLQAGGVRRLRRSPVGVGPPLVDREGSCARGSDSEVDGAPRVAGEGAGVLVRAGALPRRRAGRTGEQGRRVEQMTDRPNLATTAAT